MKKRKKVIKAGSLVLACISTPPAPRDQEHVRAAKSRMTTAARRAMNLRSARVRLELLLAANFKRNDLHVTLTYRDADLPEKRAGALKCVRKFLDQMRAYRKARGLPFQYVYVTEGKHGDKRLHHHLVINATESDFDLIRSLWVYGDQVDMRTVGSYACEAQDGECEYTTLARYITKESMEGKPVGAQMWTGSKNLIRPKEESDWVKEDETLSVPIGCKYIDSNYGGNKYGEFAYIKYMEVPAHTYGTRPPRRR